MSAHKNAILLTGGAGYIGSHTYVALVEAGYRAVIFDDFSNSHPEVLLRLQQISRSPVLCERGNVANVKLLQDIIHRHNIEAVIHFAGFKAVGESVTQPLKYYANNLGGMLSLLQAMKAVGCYKLVFSSSATVYGDPAMVPIAESFPTSHTNPYGHTKLVCEDILTSLCVSSSAWRVGVLRYFNPVGAHPSGLIGEDPRGIPNNLMPFVAQVALGKLDKLSVYGGDYPTADGTGVRDYIHVMDLAQGHVAAVSKLFAGANSFTVNLGTGRGYSVLDVIRAYEKESSRHIAFEIVGRRLGDIAACYADASLAASILDWHATRGIDEMCADSWRWQSMNPNGFINV